MLFKEATMMSSEVMALSKSKNSCKNSAELLKNSSVFVDGIRFVRKMPRILKCSKNHFVLGGQGLKKQNFEQKLLENAIEIQRTAVRIAWHCFVPTQGDSTSWIESLMAGDHEFARFLRIEAALTSENIMAWQGECLSPTLGFQRKTKDENTFGNILHKFPK